MVMNVLTKEQCLELVELGIDFSKATVFLYSDGSVYMPADWENTFGLIPTFTLQDILEMLPSYKITYDKYTNNRDKYEIRVDIPEDQHYTTHIAQSSKSLLEASFNMLKWC